MSNPAETLFIEEADADIRLDQFLAKRYEGSYSRTYFQKLIEEGLVLVNGERVKKRYKPLPGDEVEIEFLFTQETTLLPEPIPLDVLYEDEALLIINKPAGLVVHPAPGNWTGTFANALLYHCKSLEVQDGSLRPGIVHRLDKETTGVLVAAKTSEAQWKMIEAFSGRQVHKEYLAVTHGSPGDRTIEAPIGRDPKHRQKMAVVEGGRQARSHVKTLSNQGAFSLVNVVLETGRTHQIRVHLSSIGTPVVGDPLYGRRGTDEKLRVSRQLLHAALIRFTHPLTGKMMEIKAPPPQDFTFFLEQYRLVD